MNIPDVLLRLLSLAQRKKTVDSSQMMAQIVPVNRGLVFYAPHTFQFHAGLLQLDFKYRFLQFSL